VGRDPDRSKLWKVEHSWWLGLIALSAGFLTWASFAYIGLRTKRRRWQAWAAAYLMLIVAATYLLNAYDQDSWGVAAGTIGLLGCWAGGFVHGLAIRGEVLELLSLDEDPRLLGARRRLLTRSAAGELARRNPALAHEAGIGQEADTYGGLVDVNGANADELARLPGFTPALGRRVVEVRERIGGFDNVDDFANLLDLPPRLVDRIRDRLICLPR
jgi:helix-hairpin-helix protein